MKKNPVKSLLSVGLCVLTLCVLGGRSFSAETIISVLPKPGDPFMNSDAGVSFGGEPGIFGIPESTSLSGTALDQRRDPYLFPKEGDITYVVIQEGIYINDIWANDKIVKVTDSVRVKIWYCFNNLQEATEFMFQGDRFIAIYTPWGEWFSLVNHAPVKGIQSVPYSIPELSAWEQFVKRETVLEVSFLGLPLGRYQFYLAHDRLLNGILDMDSLSYAVGTVDLVNPMEVSLEADPLSGQAPLEVTYQVTVNDPQGTAATCKLLLEPAEFVCNTTGSTEITYTYEEAGTYAARAEVTDIYDRTVMSDIVMVTVEEKPKNQPPTVSGLSVSPSAVTSGDLFNINYYYDDPDGLDDVKTHFIGIGTWSGSYAAEGSGQFLHYYSFQPGTTPGVHYITVYVKDSVGNTSNALNGSIIYMGDMPEGNEE